MKKFAIIVVAVVFALASGTVRAATLTWTGAVDGNWDAATANWSGGSGIFVDGVDDVIFDNAAGGTINISPNMSPLSTTVSAASGTYTFNGGPIDSGSLTKSGGGTLWLNNPNTYTGGTVLNGGNVNPGNLVDGVFGTGPVTLNNGASVGFSRQNEGAIRSTNQWIVNSGAFVGGNSFSDWNYGAITLNGQLTVDTGSTGNRHLLGIISGAGRIVKTGWGNGSLYLYGANTYSGGTSNAGGWVKLGHTNALGTGTLWMDGVGQCLSAEANLNVGTGVTNSIMLLKDCQIVLWGNWPIVNYDMLLSGPISGPGGITIIGNMRKLVLSGANTFSGSTTINSAWLVISNSLALQNSTLICTNFSANTNVAFAAGITNFTLGGLSGTNDLALTNQAGAVFNLTIGNSLGIGSSYDGVLSGGGSLTKIGNSTFTLTATNTYTGYTAVSNGTLSVTHAQALSANVIYLSSSANLNLNFTGTMTNYMLIIKGVAWPTGTYGSNNFSQITGPGKVCTLWPPLSGMVITIR